MDEHVMQIDNAPLQWLHWSLDLRPRKAHSSAGLSSGQWWALMESGLRVSGLCVGADVETSASKFSETQPLQHSTSHTFLRAPPAGLVGIYWNNSLGSSVEGWGKGVKCVYKRNDGWVSGRRQRGIWQVKMEKNNYCHQNILLRDKGTSYSCKHS